MYGKLEIVGDAIMFQGMKVAELQSERDVPATVLDEFRRRLGEKPGNYHPMGAYDAPERKLRIRR